MALPRLQDNDPVVISAVAVVYTTTKAGLGFQEGGEGSEEKLLTFWGFHLLDSC
jgi:hypothetical protein